MEYSILGFNQERVCELKDKNSVSKQRYIDTVDLLILKYMSKLINNEKVFKYNINGHIYSCVHYKAILENLPILRIRKQALVDRIDKLCSFGLIEKELVRNQAGTWTAFRLLENFNYISHFTHKINTKKDIKNYYEKLKDPRWQKKRLEILNRDCFKCQKCGKTSQELHVHHLFYKPDAEPLEYDNDSLVTLCGDCHSKIHS